MDQARGRCGAPRNNRLHTDWPCISRRNPRPHTDPCPHKTTVASGRLVPRHRASCCSRMPPRCRTSEPCYVEPQRLRCNLEAPRNSLHSRSLRPCRTVPHRCCDQNPGQNHVQERSCRQNPDRHRSPDDNLGCDHAHQISWHRIRQTLAPHRFCGSHFGLEGTLWTSGLPARNDNNPISLPFPAQCAGG